MRRMHKKGADISITVIIVAAIALIVFVVLIAIFTGRIGIFSRGVNDATLCANLAPSAACQEASCDSTKRQILTASDCGKKLENGVDNTLKRYCCAPAAP